MGMTEVIEVAAGNAPNGREQTKLLTRYQTISKFQKARGNEVGEDLSTVTAIVTRMQTDVDELKTSIKSIADALTKLAVLDERQITHFRVLEKQLIRIENIELRMQKFDLDLANHTSALNQLHDIRDTVSMLSAHVAANQVRKDTVTNGVKALWAVVGGVITSLVIYLITGGV